MYQNEFSGPGQLLGQFLGFITTVVKKQRTDSAKITVLQKWKKSK
jgi:hypothetical protein